MNLEHLGFLSVGSQMRRIYEKLQSKGDIVYKSMDIDFKSSWFPVYYALSNTNRALTVNEIAEEISYTRITVKNVVREMELVSYISIIPNPLDSRSKLIQLTEIGESIAPKLQSVWDLFYHELKNVFGENGDVFLHQLSQINHKLNATPLEKLVLKGYHNFQIRNALPDEFERIGTMLVEVYAALPGFPKKEEQPKYYDMLKNIGNLTTNKSIELLVAVSKYGQIGGAVVYFNDMKDYGSGGTATQEKNACGFRLLGVDPEFRGFGLGKSLTEFCIAKGKNSDSKNMVIHTTKSMKQAWHMYENLGFKPAQDLDFMQDNLPVFGFRLNLQ